MTQNIADRTCVPDSASHATPIWNFFNDQAYTLCRYSHLPASWITGPLSPLTSRKYSTEGFNCSGSQSSHHRPITEIAVLISFFTDTLSRWHYFESSEDDSNSRLLLLCFFHDASDLLTRLHQKSFITKVIAHYSIFLALWSAHL